jgi:hypothetical protein
MADGVLESGAYRIEIRCPHVEDGSCSACMWPQIMPFVGARTTLDHLLPQLKLLGDALREEAERATSIAKATDKMRDWIEQAATAKWDLGPAEPVAAPSDSKESNDA